MSDYSISSHSSGAQLCTLPNGLTIILLEDKNAPVVSVQAWCEAGSIHEDKWLGAGLSHVLEHMLFKGTTTRGKGRIDQEVQEAGGYMNAYTSFDRTVYYINTPSSGTHVAVDILCDIMQNASLPEDELISELDVIRREMDMNHDDPARRSGRGLFETAYLHSPYRYTVIGYPDVFNRISRGDVFDYYRKMYTPSNQFFIVVGDIDIKKIADQISAAYKGSPFSPLPPAFIPPEPPQLAPRQRVEESSIELGHTHLSWHIPDIRHEDLPALETLSIILGGGRSSRLYRSLREEQGIVHAIDAWTYNPGNPGLFGISAVFDGGQYEKAVQGIEAELQGVREKGVTSSEVAKAVKQFTSATLAARKTMQGQAQDLGGAWMAARDLGFSNRYLSQVQSITAEKIVEVANRYMFPDNRSTFALLPKGSSPVSLKKSANVHRTEIEKWEPGNGMRVLFKQDDRLPFVEIRSVFFGGVLEESNADSGITQLMSQGLLKGTADRSAAEIMEAIEAIGGSVEAYAGNNSFGLNIEVLNQDVKFGLDLLRETLRFPSFPSTEMERERQVQMAGIRAQKDQLLGRCFKLMKKGLFGEKGYGLSNAGEESSVQSLSIEQIKSHHGRLVKPGNQVLSIFGDIDIEQVKKELSNLWEDSSESSMIELPQSPSETRVETLALSETCDKKQSVVVFGFPGTTFFDKERHALDLLQETCSDLGSRLFMRIRDELGLAYYVGAQHMPGIVRGYFGFYAGTSPEHVEQVKEEFKIQINKIKSEGITQQELDRSKAKMLGQKQIARQDLGHLAMASALDELYGLGFQHPLEEDAAIRAVSLEDVQKAAEKIFDLENSTVAVVGP
ncbi:MAG: insulinase family protein [Verrucomicrobia bacterium]|nr:insulinase family protein [Verrucomicrobiota bacterium]MBT5477630.1 insulinase family protein [Verrucomicrobiota bacterium]